ncbi:MAG TPA: CAP domain-containing protein [Solirubrobacterales bacterium]|nr:CAP domain-containing protein [Solirubrobacterales bacterium]
MRPERLAAQEAGALPGDKEWVRRLLSIAVVGLILLGLGAPNAAAVGLSERQAVSKPARAATSGGVLIAPEAACPGQDRRDAPAAAQIQTMRCMTEYARKHAGLAPFAPVEQLDASAGAKSEDVLRCDDFSHYACGRDFTFWMRETGYLSEQCWRAGENLAWGSGDEGTAGSIFRAWMRSPGHRENILGEFSQLGVGLRVGDLEGLSGVRVWAQHFGSHCEAG